MTLQISQRGKECLKTAETLLRTAKTMTDQAIAGQLKALAGDYERRAERLRAMMQPRHWLDQLPVRNRSGSLELMGRLAQRLSGRP